jgi:hypothetical protein
MKARKLFPEGMIVMSIPWDQLPAIMDNLGEMKWVPHSYTIDKDAHKAKAKKIAGELRKKLAADK